LTIGLAILTQYRSVTDELADRQTNGLMHAVDGIAVSLSHVAFMNENANVGKTN